MNTVGQILLYVCMNTVYTGLVVWCYSVFVGG